MHKESASLDNRLVVLQVEKVTEEIVYDRIEVQVREQRLFFLISSPCSVAYKYTSR